MKGWWVAAALLLSLGFLPAQTIDDNITRTASSSARIFQERAAYIMINTHYRLVPGDTFILAYAQRDKEISLPFFVDEDYNINLNYMGVLNVEGMTFSDLKKKVNTLVQDSFPGSYSQLTIKSPGVFMIPVKGESKAAIQIPAWGFMRLSEAIEQVVTNYTSSRHVEIISRGGESRFYDLYEALRYGEEGADPFLQLGDTIILHKYDRMVRIDGEVRRPGDYELLEGEDLATLLAEQADGFTAIADRSRISIQRTLSETSEYGETFYLDLSEGIPNDFHLNNMDLITIPLKAVFQPRVYFQGALTNGETVTIGEMAISPGITISNKVPVPIFPGEKLSSALLRIQEHFNLGSDLTKAVLSRTGEAGVTGGKP